MKTFSRFDRAKTIPLLTGLALVVLASIFFLPASGHGPPKSRGQKTVNVLSYGADRSGKSDSLIAFKKALAAAPGGTIYIPTGTYVCSATISLINQSAIGDGAGSVVAVNDSQFSSVFNLTGGGSISKLAIADRQAYQPAVLVQNITKTFSLSNVTLALASL